MGLAVIVVLILGGLYLYQSTWTNAPAKNAPEKSIKNYLPDEGTSQTQPENETRSERQDQNYASILSRIFKPSLFIDRWGDTSGADNIGGSPEDPELQETKKEIRDYLIASSDIGFPEDNSLLKKALEEAEGGNPQDLIEIRNEYQKSLEELKKLSPPEPLKDVHEKSIGVVEKSIGLLEETIHQTGGSVEETWNSDKRLEIVGEAQEVRAEILRVVETYQIHLPPGVVSY